ncbi:MAG: anion permease [Blastocatellia bacterium]|nr:anion permease [Blastocatellia bacterium]MCS7156636.1 anion permease [Blastocatellia bacterium]MDW8168722.1 DASS family sodium-coupled anion symporter [Acidobacteriota bacterium]MDW8256988.1 DASS family sodium-coupled anion symporter [Acidobacteriota bacterium]
MTGLGIALAPVPEGVARASWNLLAIFAATIVGLIVQPVPGGAMVLLGVLALAVTGTMPVNEALSGYADPIVWLVLAAFFFARGMIKTGLGRRIAFLFIRAVGRHSLGLGYALATTDLVLATIIPSNGARAGGILFPIARSLAEAYNSQPGDSARRLGAFLMVLVYQCEVIVCAMFLTGQASNPLIAKFAEQVAGVSLTYARWALGALVPGALSFLLIPLLLYRLFPPEQRRTPEAAALAEAELKRLGPMSRQEKMMLAVFLIVASLWMTMSWHGLHYAVIALLGIALLLLGGVLTWEDVISERGAWDVFLWYGGLVRMGGALGETDLTRRFAEAAAAVTEGWNWWGALLVLALVYFYAHYGFASITAHATAMYIPFLIVVLAAGAPAPLAVHTLAYLSNLMAGLTHYGTTPAPIYFGAGYVAQTTWWRLGLIASWINLAIWFGIGSAWWKMLGWWS